MQSLVEYISISWPNIGNIYQLLLKFELSTMKLIYKSSLNLNGWLILDKGPELVYTNGLAAEQMTIFVKSKKIFNRPN